MGPHGRQNNTNVMRLTGVRRSSLGDKCSSNSSWMSQSDSSLDVSKEHWRPPVYNPEDYAVSLKKWIRKSPTSVVNTADPTCKNISSGDSEPEMSLRQFSSVTDLLNKLKTDLRLAYSSFVQEFVADPTDGVVLLLEFLRSMQLNQNDNKQTVKVSPAIQRKTLLDENSCLLCLKYCLRCQDATRRLAMSSTGLFTLAVCIMSNVTKSRIIALEILTKTCDYPNNIGHTAVSEAMSTMRLHFGEPARFRFLVGMLSSASNDLLLAGLRFIISFLETSPKKQMQLYIQAEFEQAGLDIDSLRKSLTSKNFLNEQIFDEIDRWNKLYIDIENLQNNYDDKCKEITEIKEKMLTQESQIQILQKQNESLLIKGNNLKRKCLELEHEICKLGCTTDLDTNTELSRRQLKGHKEGNSTPAEDEGISSSDQDECEDVINNNDYRQNSSTIYPFDNESIKIPSTIDDTTIEEVLEDFQDIINNTKIDDYPSNNYDDKINVNSSNNQFFPTQHDWLNGYSNKSRLEEERDIVPSKILPEPPRKSKGFFLLEKNFELNPFFEDDDESCDNSECSFTSQEFSHVTTNITKRQIDDMESINREKSFIIDDNDFKVKNIKRRETFHHQFRNEGNHSNNFNYKIKDKMNDIKEISKNKIIENTVSAYRYNTKDVVNMTEGMKITINNKKITSENNKTKLLRSASTKPPSPSEGNNLKGRFIGLPQPPSLPPSNDHHFQLGNKYTPIVSSTPCFMMKRFMNAGLYSGKHNVSDSINSNNLSRVTSITSDYPNRSLNGLKQINLNVSNGKIMDLPCGLY